MLRNIRVILKLDFSFPVAHSSGMCERAISVQTQVLKQCFGSLTPVLLLPATACSSLHKMETQVLISFKVMNLVQRDGIIGI